MRHKIDYMNLRGNGIWSSELKFYDGNGFEIKHESEQPITPKPKKAKKRRKKKGKKK